MRMLARSMLLGIAALLLAGCGGGKVEPPPGIDLPEGTEAIVVEISDELGREGLSARGGYKGSDGGGFVLMFRADQDFGGGKFRWTAYDRRERVLKEGTFQMDNMSRGDRKTYRDSTSGLDGLHRIVVQSRAK